ncbi:hypothetical protein BKE30_08235 [Alkanindiges hydrocarboniclasticus]|jgi:hypothetical protein|uniref:DUF7944 domain-containing protein n=1 Tax=Alkanindiges hydrocarboniclasticus TaxID=1907941 RepID=A0A1S8CVX5_9GAMM|nr:hypothetical protein [Alkanindiges hydrocarboniclasticus]ONG39772.1 hypothetical protein BKE30_08235 [Alkanindiges hydrocarboniclasticus]
MTKTNLNFTNFPWVKTLAIAVLCTTSIATVNAAPASSAASQTASKGDKVEFKSSLPVTQEEIAAVDILGEICPKLIGNSKKFDNGYERLLKDLMPNIDQPVMALKALADDAEYQGKLKEAREDANKASVQDNRAVCQDIVNYPANSNKTKK